MKVKGVDGKWQPVRIPSSVKALVLLNLQSYGGGRDIWGLADSNKDTRRGWKTPIFNDGMFEVLILQYHNVENLYCLLMQNKHCSRIQCCCTGVQLCARSCTQHQQMIQVQVSVCLLSNQRTLL